MRWASSVPIEQQPGPLLVLDRRPKEGFRMLRESLMAVCSDSVLEQVGHFKEVARLTLVDLQFLDLVHPDGLGLDAEIGQSELGSNPVAEVFEQREAQRVAAHLYRRGVRGQDRAGPLPRTAGERERSQLRDKRGSRRSSVSGLSDMLWRALRSRKAAGRSAFGEVLKAYEGWFR